VTARTPKATTAKKTAAKKTAAHNPSPKAAHSAGMTEPAPPPVVADENATPTDSTESTEQPPTPEQTAAATERVQAWLDAEAKHNADVTAWLDAEAAHQAADSHEDSDLAPAISNDVVAAEGFTASVGTQLVTVEAGERIHGDLAVYLSSTGAPVTPYEAGPDES
jgi:hypothetical protein